MKLTKQDEAQIKKHHEWMIDFLGRIIQDRLEALPYSEKKEIDAEVIKELKLRKNDIERIRDSITDKKETWV